jgi:hypothetical protein
MRQRGERIERSFAHLYDTGGMRRTHLRGHTNILKRLLIHAVGFNLGLVMRHLIGSGTPRGLQDRPSTVVAALFAAPGRSPTLAGRDFRMAPTHRGGALGFRHRSPPLTTRRRDHFHHGLLTLNSNAMCMISLDFILRLSRPRSDLVAWWNGQARR